MFSFWRKKIELNSKIRNDSIARALVCSLFYGISLSLSFEYVLCFAAFFLRVSTYCRISVHRVLFHWLHAMQESNIYYLRLRHHLNYNISLSLFLYFANFVRILLIWLFLRLLHLDCNVCSSHWTEWAYLARSR